MYTQYCCLQHQGQQIIKVCVETHCKCSKLLCNQCIQESKIHKIHQKIDFKNFLKISQKLINVNQNSTKLIKQKIASVKEIFLTYLSNLQEIIQDNFNFGLNQNKDSFFTKQIEIQELYGIVSNFLKDKNVSCYFSQNIKVKMVEELKKQELNLVMKELKSYEDNFLTISKDMVKALKKNQNSQIKNYLQQYKNNSHFNFSEELKSEILSINEKRKTITRNNYRHKNGYSVYGITEQPFSQQNSEITFKIQHQGYRHMYIGVCQPQKFRQEQFEGPLYKMKKGMIGIRQSQKEGNSAITLHNSLEEYSNNAQLVGWDFKVGDEIKIEYKHSKNKIILTKNNKNKFSMPLDQGQKQYYPFVGMKCTNDKISIVSKRENE